MKEIVAACCVILNKEGEILALHRNTEQWNHWELPGGKPESSETLEFAAKRETKEETSLEVEVIRKLGMGKVVENDTSLEFHWFLARVVAGVPGIPELEKMTFDKIQYLSLEKLQEKNRVLSYSLRGLVAEYLQGNISLQTL